MPIGLLTDSPSDLPDDLVRRYGIEVIRAVLVVDGQPHLDGKDISREEFYKRLPGMRIPPTTASASSHDFAAGAAKLFESGCQQVLGIFTAEKLTGTSDIARQAAGEFDGKFIVVESGSLSMGTGFQVLAAAESIEKGFGLAPILEEVQSVRRRLKVYAALDTLEYVRRSGRVPRAVSALGGLLNIKPVVELREGQVHPLDAPRTNRRAAEKLLSLLAELGPLERLSILHTNAETRARDLLARLETQLGGWLPADIRILNVTTVIGTHVGPFGLGVAAVRCRS